ncbi:MAG: TIGR01459 family HAD-type hydrolase [Hyphomicrobiaceae bacterium]|nr:TIGR01459 family HAD-type hydrolase [Hyphomicrobiaceae bacterium]
MRNVPPIIEFAGPLLLQYDVLFCDVWGVVHDGVNGYKEGCAALAKFRNNGGTVILVSNAPRRENTVRQILHEKSVPDDISDAIIASGDLALLFAREQGFRQVHHIGPMREQDLFDNSDFQCVSLTSAEVIFCTGLAYDWKETGEDYRELLRPAVERGLSLICANPDLAVCVGGRLLPCAGAIAKVYEDLGGNVHWAGKPFAIAYKLAQKIAGELRGEKVDKSRILAIGDSVRTDIVGAAGFGVDTLFIGQGIHRDIVMSTNQLDVDALDKIFSGQPIPTAAMTTLRW